LAGKRRFFRAEQGLPAGAESAYLGSMILHLSSITAGFRA
jgi:hypothetical protein